MTTTLNNRYRIEKTLGRGGFGQTFLASDTHMPSGRQCVIKQLQPAVQDPATERWILDCFQREAATLEDLGEAHPQIPCLYAYFAEAGHFFLVQEYIPGPTLQQKVRDSGPFNESAVCSLLADILPVLDFVHSRRIIHRDIKPDNIILREKDGKPVLIDFGAVKEAIATVYDNHGRTNHSVAVGTPGYMASEQAAGRPVFSSDLYSLGLTVIYLLTGKHPGQLQADPRTGEILWESETPRLSRALAAVLDRATRFHPRDRYASAKEMLEALQLAAVPSGAATWVAAPASHSYRSVPQSLSQPAPTYHYVAPPTQRKQGWGLAFLLFLLAAIAGGAFAIGYNLFSQSEPEQDEATQIQPDSPRVSQPPVVSAPEPEPEPAPAPEPLPEVTPEVPVATEPATPEPEAPSLPVEPLPEPESTEPPPASQTRSVDVVAIAPGSSEEQLQATLGEPTEKREGFWPDSRAWLYKDLVPNEVDAGYLLDANSGKVRQTEASFAPSVDLASMQATLARMTGGSLPPAAAEGLEQVYLRQTDLRSFEAGNFKGIIQRNAEDRIYVGVWEADFHD